MYGVYDSKVSTFVRFRGEVLKERHSTAKKLRKYYLQCLKQLLEEDRIALEGNVSPSSTEDKLNRMAEALRTLSPDKEAAGECINSPFLSLSISCDTRGKNMLRYIYFRLRAVSLSAQG